MVGSFEELLGLPVLISQQRTLEPRSGLVPPRSGRRMIEKNEGVDPPHLTRQRIQNHPNAFGMDRELREPSRSDCHGHTEQWRTVEPVPAPSAGVRWFTR